MKDPTADKAGCGKEKQQAGKTKKQAEKSRGGTAERADSRCGDKGCPAVLSLWMQRKAAAISPPTIPRTAIATDGVKAV